MLQFRPYEVFFDTRYGGDMKISNRHRYKGLENKEPDYSELRFLN